MPNYVAPKPRRASDTHWVLTLLGITAAVVVCMFVAGFFLTQHWNKEADLRAQQQQFEAYRRSAPTPIPASTATTAAPEPSAAQLTRAKLLAHPAVTPGPGFDSPGVQSTGMAIVDAIDDAQARTSKPQ